MNQTIFCDCLWLLLRTSVIEEVYKPGFTAYNIICPETCGSCNAAAPVLILLPTIGLIILLQPSSTPMITVPSSSLSTCVNCDNVPFDKPPLIDGGEEVCVWLAARDCQAQRDIYFIPGQLTYNVCKEMCGKCSYTSYCVDTNNHFLYLNPRTNQTESHDCLWLLSCPLIQETKYIQGKTINDITYPETCNSCDAPESLTLSPTAMAPGTTSPRMLVPGPTNPMPAPTFSDNDWVIMGGVLFFDGKQRDCAWLAVKPAVQALETLLKNYWNKHCVKG